MILWGSGRKEGVKWRLARWQVEDSWDAGVESDRHAAHRPVAVLGHDDVELADSLAFHVVVLVAIEQQDEVARGRNLEIAREVPQLRFLIEALLDIPQDLHCHNDRDV